MMKIGVVTYVRTDNYGAELQGYALQQKLNLMGHNAECLDFDKVTFDTQTKREMIKNAIVRRLKNNPIKAIPSIFKLVLANIKMRIESNKGEKTQYQICRESAFEEFWRNEIRHSRYYSNESLYQDEKDYDLYIAGSDQIWNYTRTGFLDPYFLTFEKDINKRHSYAASFSVSHIPDRLKKKYSDLINGMSSLAVREIEGINIIKELTRRDAKLVLDPTLLLEKKDWMKVSSDKYVFNEPYIFTYSLNTSSAYWKIVYAHAEKYHMKIVNLRHDFHIENTSINRIDIFDAGPREFIYLLANASLVITNSFHGTIFSINFNVPFVSVLNRISETNSRITSILNTLGLTDRLCYDDEKLLVKDCSIDFSRCNLMLAELRKDSVEYLLKIVEGK